VRVDSLASLLARTKPMASPVADAFDIRPNSWLENSLLYPISSYITLLIPLTNYAKIGKVEI